MTVECYIAPLVPGDSLFETSAWDNDTISSCQKWKDQAAKTILKMSLICLYLLFIV